MGNKTVEAYQELGYKLENAYDTGMHVLNVALVLDDSEILDIKEVCLNGKIKHYATYYLGNRMKW